METPEQERQRIRDEDRKRRWDNVSAQLGSRYAGCRLDNFVFSTNLRLRDSQAAVVSRLRGFLEKREIGNLILYGPLGAGKDHLLAAALYEATIGNARVAWTSGPRLFSRLRDAIALREPESEVLDPLLEAEILGISDPYASDDALTPHQKASLFHLVDERYRRRRPIWMTLNCAKEGEAAEILGERVASRLRHGAVALFCNWPDYRMTKEG